MACIVIPNEIQKWMLEAGAVEPLLASVERTIQAADVESERLRAALTDCVAVLLGEISGISQKEGVIRRAVDGLNRPRQQPDMKDDMRPLLERLHRHDGHLGALVDEAADEIGRLAAALEDVMVGGNHLANYLIGQLGGGFSSHFPPTMLPLDAVKVLKNDVYDVWCCWAAMMRAREALTGRLGGKE